MTNLARVSVTTTGYQGAPGYNILHFSGGISGDDWDSSQVQDLYDELYTVYSALAPMLDGGVIITIDPEVTIIDDATNYVVNIVTVGTPTGPITATGSTNAVPFGGCVCNAFLTDQFVAGRRLIGRAFIGPVDANTWDTDGTVMQGYIDDMVDAWSGMLSGAGPRLAVYHRPAGGAHTGGYYGDVVSVVPRKRPSYLRSRVD